VKLIGIPVQPPALGVTVIVAVIAVAVAFTVVNAGIVPVPLAPSPIAVLLFVQLYVAPATLPLSVTAASVVPAHTDWLPTAFTSGVGFTVIVKLIGVPVQVRPPLLNVGVIVIVVDTGAFVRLMPVNAGILPTPLAALNPIFVLLFVQLYTVFVTGPLTVTAVVLVPWHTVWFAIAFTAGVGFTVIVNVIGVPVQPAPFCGVIVIVATTGAAPTFVATKLGILPAPTAARPMPGWLFVHVKNVPGTGPVNITAVELEPLHNNWLAGGGDDKVAVGFTVIVNVVGVPTQVTPPFV